MKSIFVLTLLIGLCSCALSQNKEKANLEKEDMKSTEEATPSQDQIDRKNRSIEFCKKKGIPTIDHLPVTESLEETVIRSKEEIVNRALVLCYLGLKSEGLEEKHLQDFEKDYDLLEHFSPEELRYKESKDPTRQQTINANWRYESLHVMLWALGYIDSLSYPSELCVVADDVSIIVQKTKEELMAGAKLRSKEEILEQADLIYRIDWACVNARIQNEAMPAGLSPGVVYERHYSLNWLINYMNQDWDDVTTDT